MKPCLIPGDIVMRSREPFELRYMCLAITIGVDAQYVVFWDMNDGSISKQQSYGFHFEGFHMILRNGCVIDNRPP